ncbi:helix-turn-helix domain-containing protein [Pyxidicoccus fallax]|uniref:Helix-turn-helix domain-containing protein n=1 Tax=Pyxidicoccus fallax TaxID=394095 RepID=A0A848LD33_9BACT|nr:helix-turn-helix domain-containing protein [Pyxidicoccus fallax]NMO16376.1 helix-turn-helix domain-containing protein [Pyxidicoccus fallax]NPC78180.1 helix-turn-helix domain-containing protein [Pyxidicoccus fallax]
MDTELASMLGAASRAARVRMGLTQADVAERIGMASEVYGRLERGHMLPSVQNLRRLCVVLNVPPHELLGLGENLAAPPPAKDKAPGPVKVREDDTPEMRRLMRNLRKLSPVQLKLMNLVASAMQQKKK